MSEWITDRLPTVDDAQNMAGSVWLARPIDDRLYETVPVHWTRVKLGDVWRPLVVPIYKGAMS